MKKSIRILCAVFAFVMIASCLAIGVGASSAYQTYTYSIGGFALYSPDAYVADKVVDTAAAGKVLVRMAGSAVRGRKAAASARRGARIFPDAGKDWWRCPYFYPNPRIAWACYIRNRRRSASETAEAPSRSR